MTKFRDVHPNIAADFPEFADHLLFGGPPIETRMNPDDFEKLGGTLPPNRPDAPAVVLVKGGRASWELVP